VLATLTGGNFAAGAAVEVANAGITVSGVNVVNATQITAMLRIAANAATGAANVTVTTSAGTSNAVSFTVIPVPSIGSVNPTIATAGAQIAISGSGFGLGRGAGAVWLGTTPATVVNWADTQILATVASSAQSGNARVQQNGAWSNAVPFSVITPAISTVAPTIGLPGASVTIAGSGFGAAQGAGQVWLGTAAGVVQSWSDTLIVAQVGASAASGNAQVLQGGVMSNAVPFTVNTPQLASISPTSGVAGTAVTFAGSGFGASPGVVWLGSMAGQVQSWTDTQVTAWVAPTAVSGIARVQSGGRLWSNALGFAVPPPGGNAMTLLPSLLNMVVGDTHTIQALSAAGQSVTGLIWTSSNPAVVSLSASDPPILTALAAGHVTIAAGTASADVTVSAGELAVGSATWSNPGNWSGVRWIVPAVPSSSGLADVFAFQNDGTVQAITSDGTTAWTADVSQGYYLYPGHILPDFQGGLVATGYNSIWKLDGITGQPYPAYTFDGEPGNYPPVAVHTDGTIFTVLSRWESGDMDTDSVIGIDPTTGTRKFSVSPQIVGGEVGNAGTARGPVLALIVAGDGYLYAPYAYREYVQPDVPGGVIGHLRMLRISTDGTSEDFSVYDWAAMEDDYVLWLGGIITNAGQGTVLTFETDENRGYFQWMATTTGKSVSLVSAPQDPSSVENGIKPVLQAQDGSFVGEVPLPDSYYYDMVAFDATGKVRWIVPNEQPHIATADGGVIGASGITYDANGNATGQMNLYTQSWRGIEYSGQGAVQSVEGSLILEDDASFWPTAGGNPSGNGTAFVQCPCLLQSSADSGSSGDIRKLEAAAAGPPQQQLSTPPGPPSYVLLVGDPGLNTVDCATNIRHCHNMGQIFVATAQTMANQLNNQGNLAYPPIRVSTVQDFEAGLTQNGSITGGVVYVGHGGAIRFPSGLELSALAPGEQPGPDTNISAQNVQSLSNAQLGPHAVMKLWACDAGKGGRNSVAQSIANQLQIVVYAPVMGVYFSNDPNVKAPDGTKLPVPNVSLPVYPIQQFGNPLVPFCPGMLCR
jgi:hypothetical protein